MHRSPLPCGNCRFVAGVERFGELLVGLVPLHVLFASQEKSSPVKDHII